jgi:hypothetical protein
LASDFLTETRHRLNADEPTAKNGVVADLFERLGFNDGSFSRDLSAGVDDLPTQIGGCQIGD